MQFLGTLELAEWVRINRSKKNWSIEELARRLHEAGYPTSTNKIWRLETKKAKKIDYELLVRLESLFCSFYETETIEVTDVINLINAYQENRVGDLKLDHKCKMILAHLDSLVRRIKSE